MQIDKLQQSLNGYAVMDDSGYVSLQRPITLKSYGTDGILASCDIEDYRDEGLQLFVSGGAQGHYIISDHGYAHAAILMIDNGSSVEQDADAQITAYLNTSNYAGLECVGGQVISSATDADFPEKLLLFFKLLKQINNEIYYADPSHGLCDSQNPHDDEQENPYQDLDVEPDFDAIRFWYQGRAYSGSDLIANFPHNPQLHAAYQRYSDAVLTYMVEGMSLQTARKHAQTLIDAEPASLLMST